MQSIWEAAGNLSHQPWSLSSYPAISHGHVFAQVNSSSGATPLGLCLCQSCPWLTTSLCSLASVEPSQMPSKGVYPYTKLWPTPSWSFLLKPRMFTAQQLPPPWWSWLIWYEASRTEGHGHWNVRTWSYSFLEMQVMRGREPRSLLPFTYKETTTYWPALPGPWNRIKPSEKANTGLGFINTRLPPIRKQSQQHNSTHREKDTPLTLQFFDFFQGFLNFLPHFLITSQHISILRRPN